LGKLYSSELSQLPTTYEWAMSTSVDSLARVIEASLTAPLIATGSGGSLTVAHFASWLHQQFAGKMAKAVTPFDLVTSGSTVRDATVLMLTARGGNPDIIGGFKSIVVREPQRLIVMCSRTKSPLSRLVKSYRYVDLVDFDLPTGRDGFLATNSLLAFAIMLSRAWTTALSIELELPQEIDALVHPDSKFEHFVAELAILCLPVWQQETVNVLYGPSAHPAALDLESKFTEAALGVVQIADYRNFAHGRHHWLAKRGHSSGVIAFVTDDDRQLASKTLSLIPPDIPVARVDIPFRGLRANLASLVTVLHLAGLAGKARRIDPGRPGVPQFGSKIYKLSALGGLSKRSQPLSGIAAASIERKTELTIENLWSRGELDFWKKAYAIFLDRLQIQPYGGIVFDYDGTLCDSRDRYKGIENEVIQNLVRLLGSGVLIGIATGRGKSVRKTLRSSLPKSLWSRVVIGYYNGSDNGLLSDDSHPDSTDCSCDELLPVLEVLNSDSTLLRLSKYLLEHTCRRSQITVQMKEFAPVSLIRRAVQQAVHKVDVPGVEVVYSSHSVDVIAPGVSKQRIVEQVRQLVTKAGASAVLCVGDLGQWPGNDFALLKGPHSLSVDAVSSDPESCWNIAPPGHRGVQAVLDYLGSLRLIDGALKFTMPPQSDG
jgi:fructoselysine-6-P-deglycase FrlB-like protein